MNNTARKRLAQETLEVLKNGKYEFGGQLVNLPDLTPMLSGTQLFTSLEAPQLLEALQAKRHSYQTNAQVTDEDTFTATRRVQAQFGEVAALNFASANNPGGGFLSGARSQEEDLARSSGLYLSLTQPQVEGYYLANRATDSALYTNHLIYSPAVPVFRDSSAAFLPAPVLVNVITAPAPNAGAVLQNQPTRFREIPNVLRERAALVLGVAALKGQRNLVLGAWGCGVFQNDPAQVADIFRDLLENEAAGAFANVVFAIYDRQPQQPVLGAFQRIWG